MIDITDIKDDLYQLIDDIKETKEYLELKTALDDLMNDAETHSIIVDFNKRKQEYELNKSNANAKNLSMIKEKLYKNKLYIIYKEKLKCYNEIVKNISNDIDNSIYSDNVKKLLEIR